MYRVCRLSWTRGDFVLAKKRQDAIVEEVNLQGSVLVKELAIKYEVTEDSIRKDLTLLQKKGLLKKTYGGAVRTKGKMNDVYVSQRLGKNVAEKQAIAQAAYELIETNDMVFLDTSTTNVELAKLLIHGNKQVTVVTNMIEIMLMYSQAPDKKFIFIGGLFSDEYDAFVGPLTDERIQEYHFDKAFIGTVGIDVENQSVYNHSVTGAITKKVAIENSEKSYIVSELRKFSLVGNYKICTFDDIDGIIVDQKPEQELPVEVYYAQK